MGSNAGLAVSASTNERVRVGFDEPQTIQTCLLFVAATAVASAIFAAVPVIDQTLARAFFSPGLGFPLAHDPVLRWLRWIGRAAPLLAVGAVVALIVVRIVRQRAWTWVSDAGLGYVVAVFTLAPLILSNLVFKANWGRPRPAQSDLFSGNLEFTPAWQIAGQCSWNCSFVSGEASMSLALIAFAFLLPKPHRPMAIAAVCAWTALISWNRMAFGAHYFSDVVLAAAMTAIVALALKAVMLDRAADASRHGRASAGATSFRRL